MPRTVKASPAGGPKPTANRTDVEPITVAPATQYGDRSRQQAAQRAVPLGSPPQGPPAAAAIGSPGAPAPTGGANGPPQPGLPPVTGPGILPFLHPSNRPNEPVTAGLPTGPGPGPEALTGVGAVVANQAAEQGSLKNLLGSLASGPTSSSAIRDLAAVAGAG
jgi:hypothetical protein